MIWNLCKERGVGAEGGTLRWFSCTCTPVHTHSHPLSFSHFNTISARRGEASVPLAALHMSQFCLFWTGAWSESIFPHTLVSPHCSAKVRALATQFTFSPMCSIAMANITPWGPETPAKSTSGCKGLMCPGGGTRDSQGTRPWCSHDTHDFRGSCGDPREAGTLLSPVSNYSQI